MSHMGPHMYDQMITLDKLMGPKYLAGLPGSAFLRIFFNNSKATFGDSGEASFPFRSLFCSDLSQFVGVALPALVVAWATATTRRPMWSENSKSCALF